MGESEIAALYAKHGHALFRVCLGLKSADARELLHATFAEVARRRFRVNFATLCKEAARLAQATVALDDHDVLLARYLADELPASHRRDLEEELHKVAGAQVRMAVLRSERAAFYATTPPEVFAQRVAATLASRPPAPRSRALLMLVVLMLIAAVVLWQLRDRLAIPFAALVASVTPSRAPADLVARPDVAAPAEVTVSVAGSGTPEPTPTVQPPPLDEAVPSGDRVAAVDVALPSVPAPSTAAPAPSGGTGPADSGARMMTTFDFGEPLGRISLFEGKSRKTTLPAGTQVQVRANIPEPGYAAVLSLDPATQTLTPLTAALKVEPKWRVLGRFTIDTPQSLFMIFSPNPFVPAQVAKQKPLTIDRQARLDLSISDEAEPH